MPAWEDRRVEAPGLQGLGLFSIEIVSEGELG
jgi:hypothetical protein